MTNTAKQRALVPEIRFPEFQDAEAWKIRTLADVLQEHGSKSTGSEEVFSVSVHKGLVNQIEHLGRSFSAASTAHYNRVLPGDIVYTKSPTGEFPFGVIKQSKLDFDVIVSPLYGVFSPETSALGALLDAYFESPENAYIYLEPLVQKGAKNTININNKKFLSGSLILPVEEAEQRKIADILASLDELIALETQKLDVLNSHRAGLIQKLFPIEGDVAPRFRFTEFCDVGAWKKQKISSLLTRSVTPVNVEADDVYREIGIRSHGKGIFHKEPVLGKALGDKRVFKVEENAFVLNIVFAWEQAVAVTSSAEREMIASHRFPMYKPVERKSDVYFLKYFFLTNKGKELLGIASPGGAGRNKTLGQKEFDNLEFLSPINIEEQAAIARCLSSVDDLINSQANRISALKTHKKGLMQQIFPVLNEAES